MLNIGLNNTEQTLFSMLIKIPPNFDDAKAFIQKEQLSVESITKVGIQYAEDCFCDLGDHIAELYPELDYDIKDVEIPPGIMPDLHSTHLYEVTAFLLEYGLDPNMIIETNSDLENIMINLCYVDNEYVAADTMRLLMEHGGDPNLIIDGESIYEKVDYDLWFDAVEQHIRWRYDALVHLWMVLVAYGGEIRGKGTMVKTFMEYDSYDRFDLQKLRDHRNFYAGLSKEKDIILNVYDKKTFWKVAEW